MVAEEDVRAVTLLAPARQLAPFDVALLSVQATLSAQQGNVDVAARTLVEMVERELLTRASLSWR